MNIHNSPNPYSNIKKKSISKNSQNQGLASKKINEIALQSFFNQIKRDCYNNYYDLGSSKKILKTETSNLSNDLKESLEVTTITSTVKNKTSHVSDIAEKLQTMTIKDTVEFEISKSSNNIEERVQDTTMILEHCHDIYFT
jgi:hypothetical protein